MVTPQRQNNDHKMLFKVNYNTPKSRSSTQTSTAYPESNSESALNNLPSFHQQRYNNKYSDKDLTVVYNTPKSRSSTQSSTTSPDYVVVKVKDPLHFKSNQHNSGNVVSSNFVTPTSGNKNIHHRQRYTASHASTTTSTLISNSNSPSRKMLPTYDPRHSKKTPNSNSDGYVRYDYNSYNKHSAISGRDASSENYQSRPMFMTPLPVQLTPKTSPPSKTTISTFTGTLAGPTPPTTAKLRQRTRMIRKLREKR